jgi:hypothetical protein
VSLLALLTHVSSTAEQIFYYYSGGQVLSRAVKIPETRNRKVKSGK